MYTVMHMSVQVGVRVNDDAEMEATETSKPRDADASAGFEDSCAHACSDAFVNARTTTNLQNKKRDVQVEIEYVERC